jgi:hypothetical protein
VGLWIYELAGRLSTGSPILLNCNLQKANKRLGESTPVHIVVSRWIDIIKEKGHTNTLLVFDSYYFSAQSRQLLLQNDIKTCAAVTPNKYQDAVKMVEKRILQPGDIEAVTNDAYQEFILGYFNPDPMVFFGAIFKCYFFFSNWLFNRLAKNTFGVIVLDHWDMRGETSAPF